MRIHFVNENIGGHATMHLHLRQALALRDDVDASFYDVPPPGLARRIVSASVPGLDRLDLDLHPLRDQLARSALVRRELDGLATKPDALHVYTHNAGLLSVGHLRRVPTVVSLDVTNRDNAHRLPQRGSTRFTEWTLPLTLAFERRVFGAARKIVTHSAWAADAVVREGVPAYKVEVVPFGITVPTARPRTTDGGLPCVVFIGTSMERKGGWRLVSLWRRWLREQCRLVLVTLEPVPPEPGLEVRNDIRPGDGQLEELLSGVDVFAMPGEIDAFGYAVLEAMAASLPVVAPRVAAIPELVDDGVTGVVVSPGDDHAFADALGRLVADTPTREAMGAAGRRRVVERFDARVTTDALVGLVRGVAGA
jgi:glycosyltransferase involved in cell wall biosynthesis